MGGPRPPGFPCATGVTVEGRERQVSQRRRCFGRTVGRCKWRWSFAGCPARERGPFSAVAKARSGWDPWLILEVGVHRAEIAGRLHCRGLSLSGEQHRRNGRGLDRPGTRNVCFWGRGNCDGYFRQVRMLGRREFRDGRRGLWGVRQRWKWALRGEMGRGGRITEGPSSWPGPAGCTDCRRQGSYGQGVGGWSRHSWTRQSEGTAPDGRLAPWRRRKAEHA